MVEMLMCGHSVSNFEIMHQRIALQNITMHYRRGKSAGAKTGIDYNAFIRQITDFPGL